jgi:hypothetical protein
MLILSSILVLAFIINSLTHDDIDDDEDGPGGGLMQPAYVPTP